MSVPVLTSDDTAMVSRSRPRRWIDVVMILLAAAWLFTPFPLVAVPVALFGVVMPVRRVMTARRRGESSLLPLVPNELARSYQALRAAALLPGVVDPSELISAADDMIIDVAAVLAGRDPRGAAQRRMVRCRVHVINQMELELRERNAAWMAATAEVEQLDVVVEAVEPVEESPDVAPSEDGCLVRLLLVLFTPLFLMWDLIRGLGRAVAGLVEGVALRTRTLARLVIWGGAAMVRVTIAAMRRWREIHRRFVVSFREARYRFVAGRVRMRRRFRAVRRRLRSPSA